MQAVKNCYHSYRNNINFQRYNELEILLSILNYENYLRGNQMNEQDGDSKRRHRHNIKFQFKKKTMNPAKCFEAGDTKLSK